MRTILGPARLPRPLATLAVWFLALGLCAGIARADGQRAVLIGGGPDLEHNQVAIESNVRYLLKLLPPDASRTVLFADGDPKHETVLYESQAQDLKPSELVLALALEGRGAAHPSTLKYRAPQLSRLDGPSKKTEVASVFRRLAAEPATTSPLLLYFTGHGSPARDRSYEDNYYDLWGDGTLSVRELAAQIAKLPADQPVTLVMVQCFSGAFGNLLFENGEPGGAPVHRDIAGFFATVKERMAAGCTPAVDESEYHDFTSYFFAALTGRDRVGRVVSGADYNHDGRVTMDEAFCYSLVHDASIDIPVCTSDVLLRSAVRVPDAAIFENGYDQVRSWGTPAQQAALDQLSAALNLNGDDRAKRAFEKFLNGGGDSPRGNSMTAARRAWTRSRNAARSDLLDRFPGLREKGAPYEEARAAALRYIEGRLADGGYKDLLDADKAADKAEDAGYRQEIADAQLTRFVRLFKTVALTHAVQTGSDAALKTRLQRLLAQEDRTLFEQATAVAAR